MTLEVQLLDPGGSLGGVTEAEVLAGANTTLIGQEIPQFRAASLIGPGRYQLSGLLRGRRAVRAARRRGRAGAGARQPGAARPRPAVQAGQPLPA